MTETIDEALNEFAPWRRIPELVDCPYCGHFACFTDDVHGEVWGSWEYRIWCSSSHCRAEIRLPALPGNKSRLIGKWNRRLSRPTDWNERIRQRTVSPEEFTLAISHFILRYRLKSSLPVWPMRVFGFVLLRYGYETFHTREIQEDAFDIFSRLYPDSRTIKDSIREKLAILGGYARPGRSPIVRVPLLRHEGHGLWRCALTVDSQGQEL